LPPPAWNEAVEEEGSLLELLWLGEETLVDGEWMEEGVEEDSPVELWWRKGGGCCWM